MEEHGSGWVALLAEELGCVIGQKVRAVEEKCVLPHDGPVLEEDLRDEFCGNTM